MASLTKLFSLTRMVPSLVRVLDLGQLHTTNTTIKLNVRPTSLTGVVYSVITQFKSDVLPSLELNPPQYSE